MSDATSTTPADSTAMIATILKVTCSAPLQAEQHTLSRIRCGVALVSALEQGSAWHGSRPVEQVLVVLEHATCDSNVSFHLFRTR
jgi:hypothetical protein